MNATDANWKLEAVHFISPSVAQITWKLDTEEKAYEHFEIPFFITINDVLKRVRNVKYKFFPNNQLIATEVLKYDPEVILEALNNAMPCRIILNLECVRIISVSFHNESGESSKQASTMFDALFVFGKLENN